MKCYLTTCINNNEWACMYRDDCDHCTRGCKNYYQCSSCDYYMDENIETSAYCPICDKEVFVATDDSHACCPSCGHHLSTSCSAIDVRLFELLEQTIDELLPQETYEEVFRDIRLG